MYAEGTVERCFLLHTSYGVTLVGGFSGLIASCSLILPPSARDGCWKCSKFCNQQQRLLIYEEGRLIDRDSTGSVLKG